MRLRSADKSKAPQEKPAEDASRKKVPALISFWLHGVLGVAIVLLLAFALALFAWMDREEASSLRQLEISSNLLVRDLNGRLSMLKKRLRDWSADPQLREVFRSGSSEDLLTSEESLARNIPGVQRVRLVKPGISGAEEDPQTDPLSYAGLDLVHEAKRQRDLTLLEVHRVGSADEHLAIAAPVLDEESVLGVVHVSLPSSLLPSVAEASGESGRILFQQRVADQVVTVDPERGEAAPAALPDLQTPVQGTRLRIVAWVDDSGMLDAKLLFFVGAAFLMLVALVGVALLVPLRGLRQALAMDFAVVVALVEDAVGRKPVRPVQCRLAETQPVIEVLTGLLRGLPPETGGTPQAPKELTPSTAQGTEVGGAAEEELSHAAGEESVDHAFDSFQEPASVPPPESVPAEIFRAYDIRGLVDVGLTTELMHFLGRAVGTEVTEAGDQTVIVGRDTRSSSMELSESLVSGLRASGCDVLDLGVAPTPLVYFATRYQGDTSGVVVTASHNPESYNGLKVVINGRSLAGQQIKALRERILAGSFSRGDGRYQFGDLVADYVDQVEKDVAIARTLKVVIDCGNAAASVLAPSLFRALGCELVEINCNTDAGFPDGRPPDPTRPECLEALQRAVVSQVADLGLAFDGDGDRLGVVDSSGKIIWPDRVLMLLSADVLSRYPGTDVVFDVKCSQHLATEILRNGGRPVMWRSGHAPLKAKLQETGALLAGEWTGHIIFRERWFGFDDALYSGARLLEVLALDPRPSAEIFADLPESISTPELFVHLAEGESEAVMTAVLAQASQLSGLELFTEDGLRAETAHGWGLVRASNTQPALVFRFEADDEAELSRIKDLFRGIMERAAPELRLPF